MDLVPSGTHASASSFPSSTQFPVSAKPVEHEDVIPQSRSRSASGTTFPKYVFPAFGSSTTAEASSSGVDFNLTNQLPTYSSPNKIAYRCCPSPAGGTDTPPPLPSITSGLSTLQGILQKCGLRTSASPDKNPRQNPLDASAPPRPPLSSSRINQKIRNLDEILQDLDHYSVSRRSSIAAAERNESPALSITRHWWPEPTARDQQTRGVDHNSEMLRGSAIPDGITRINQSISRMEFKAQMEKLTGIIEGQWPVRTACRKVVDETDQKREETQMHELRCPFVASPNPTIAIGNRPRREPAPAVDAAEASASSSSLLNAGARESRLPKHTKRKISKIPSLNSLKPSRQSEQFHRCRRALPQLGLRKQRIEARTRLWVQRTAGKRMTAMLQKQLRHHLASINQRLDKTDVAVKELRRRKRDAASSFASEEETRHHDHRRRRNGQERRGRTSCSGGDLVQPGTLDNANSCNSGKHTSSTTLEVEKKKEKPTHSEPKGHDDKFREACEAMSRLQNEFQHSCHVLQKLQKQSNEQSMEIALCWTAINNLCIDNDAFRENLQSYGARLHQCQQQHQQPQPRSQPPASAVPEELHVHRVEAINSHRPTDLQ